LGGEQDPVCPIAGSEEIVSCLPPDLVQFVRFEHSGHGVFRDEPERAMSVLRDFVCSDTPNR
jgi:proline iminopeptidase